MAGIVLNAAYGGQDPTNRGFLQAQRWGYKPDPSSVVFPYNGDMVKAFPDLYVRLARSIHWNPTNLQIDHAEMMAATQSERCVQARGHVNNFGKSMMELNEILCMQRLDPNTGIYSFAAFFSLLPNAVADQQRATAAAVMASFQWNQALVKQQSDAEMAPVLAQMRQNWENQQNALIQRSQQIVGQIRQTGANATARMNATEAANDAQHAAWNQGEENISPERPGLQQLLAGSDCHSGCAGPQHPRDGLESDSRVLGEGLSESHRGGADVAIHPGKGFLSFHGRARGGRKGGWSNSLSTPWHKGIYFRRRESA